MPPRRAYRRRPITIATIIGASSLVIPTMSLVRLYVNTGSLLPLLYTITISLATFLLYGYDKIQSRNLQWRVKEVTLHTFGLLGGWPGALVGQHYFQHKTRKTSFRVPFWASVLYWQGIWWMLWSGGTTRS